MAGIWSNTSGGQYYNNADDPTLLSEEDEQGLSPYSASESTSNSQYGSTSVTKGSNSSHSEGTTRRVANRANVTEQEATELNRSALNSPYMSMLGKGNTPLADPSVTEQRALRQARTQALVRLAGNLGRMASSDADGVTGPISRDQSSNNYLTSMKTYQEALPKYNAALAKQNAALTKAQADLIKQQQKLAADYDLKQYEMESKRKFFNANANNKADLQNAHDNQVIYNENDKSGKTNSTTTTNGSKTTHNYNEKRQDAYAGNKHNDPNRSMGQIPYLVHTYDKDGKIASTKVAGMVDMGKQDFKHFLYAIEASAIRNNGDGKKWLKQMGVSDKDANDWVNALSLELKQFYEDNTKKGNTTWGDTNKVSAADLDDAHLDRLWSNMGRTLASYKNLSFLQPYLTTTAKVTNAQGKRQGLGDFINSGAVNDKESNLDYSPIQEVEQ